MTPPCLAPDNLVVRALKADARLSLGFAEASARALRSAFPSLAGLGGGSSDAAAALIGMLRLTKKKLPLERLMAIAAGLGADVPFFLFGGRALAVNRGDEIYPLPDAPKRTHPGRVAQGNWRQHEGSLPVGFAGIDKPRQTP